MSVKKYHTAQKEITMVERRLWVRVFVWHQSVTCQFSVQKEAAHGRTDSVMSEAKGLNVRKIVLISWSIV